MLDYSKIDPEFYRWAHAKGYTVQTRYRDDVVRGFEIWSVDNQEKSEIAISKLTDTDIELVVFDGKKRRERMTASVDDLTKLLDQAERLAKQWISPKK